MQGIVAEYVRLQTGRNYMCFAGLCVPQLRTGGRHSMLFERPKIILSDFYNARVRNARQGCNKKHCPIF